jgi:predicted RND superfamily exporter protein
VNRGLTLEFLLVAAFIGLAFRSIVVMLASILPGIFPVVLSGTLLWLIGEGLQFASVVALTVSFGLGLSATIHFLNRLRQEKRPDQDPAIAVERATVLVGPPLILTSVVLACGLIVTVSRSAVAAPVWLAQRVRHARRISCGPLDPSTHGHVLEQAGTTNEPRTIAPAGA